MKINLPFKKLFGILFLFFLQISLGRLYAQQVSTNNWYVGNTETGEWIKYKKVWLSEGSYRFSMQGIAGIEDQKVHIELDGQPLPSVTVPTAEDSTYTFEYCHLGHTQLSEGYYDIKLVFETGNVNCDMIFIKKDNSSATSFSPSDIAFSINRNDGMHIAPIGDHAMASATLKYVGKRNAPNSFKDANGVRYTQEQIFAYNSQPIYTYTPRFTDQAMDMWVAELVAAKADFVFMHGRGQNDFTNEVEDRDYKAADGVLDPRYLNKFVAAVNCSPYAKGNMKLGYFQDNGAYPREYQNKTGIRGRWGDVGFQDWCYNYSFKPWFTEVPKDMLYKDAEGKVPVQLWTADGNYDYSKNEPEDKMLLEYLQYIERKVKEDFGEDIRFILSDTFWKRDPRTKDFAGGVQGWFPWGGPQITEIKEHKGKKYAFAVNGKRYPFSQVWLSDWNPVTQTGTYAPGKTTDYYVSALKPDGSMAVEPVFQQGREQGAEWIVLESWCDWSEGTTWYRSDHKTEQAWPNQHIALLRKYADTESQSMVLEAEACDEYFDLSPGNSGGAYRVKWYEGETQTDLDIYRPLHKLVNVVDATKPAGDKLVNFSVGYEDFWGFTNQGKVWAHEVDATPVLWKSIARPIAVGVKDLTVGRYYAWAISKDNKVMQCELPTGGFSAEVNETWKDITGTKPMKDIDLNLKEAWGIDADGYLYHRDYDGEKDWVKLDAGQSKKLVSITAAENFIWGFDTEGNIVRVSSFTGKNWKTIPNPHQLTKIDAGGSEVWGVNSHNEVYRIEASGEGNWELLGEGSDAAVGFEFAWVQSADGNLTKYKLEGFDNKSVFTQNPATMPIQVISFDVKAEGSVAKITWETEHEIPNTTYSILRSVSDDSGFEPLVADIDAKNSGSNKENYSLYDENPNQGINYYKLTQHDGNGNSKEIGIRTANFLNRDLTVSVFPNPLTGGVINVKISGYKGEKVALGLFDLSGREIVDRLNFNYQESGIYQLSPKSALTPGMYFLEVTGDNVREVFKLVTK